MCQRNVPTRSVSEEHRLRPFRMPDSRRGNNPMNRLRSLRDYVDRLQALGEIQEIDVEVDWHLEMGAIIRRCYELQAPAPLFNTIKGIDRGFRVLGAPAGISRKHGLVRIALSVGLDATASATHIIEA